MKQFTLKVYFLSFVFLSLSYGIKAQDSSSNIDSTSVSTESIAIGDISEESEKLGQQVLKLKGKLDRSSRIVEIDSIVVLQ